MQTFALAEALAKYQLLGVRLGIQWGLINAGNKNIGGILVEGAGIRKSWCLLLVVF